MHDIDRTQAEFESEFEDFESDQYEFEFEDSTEYLGEFDGEISLESPFSEAEEMELAAELLEITSDEELDQFLGKLFKKAWRGVRGIARGIGRTVRRIARPLGGILKVVGKKALPFLGGAVGSIIPGVGTAAGTALGALASRAFEVELEGLSPEDQEFEIARRYVRLAGAAAKRAATMPSTHSPQAAAKTALMEAAQRHAPGLPALLRGTAPTTYNTMSGMNKRSGRWVRRGRKIILYGV